MQIKSIIELIKNNIFEKANSFLFGMLGAATVLMINHYIILPPNKIVTVNISGIVDNFIKQESKKNLDADIVKKEVSSFGKNLETKLSEFSKKNHFILLPSEAVITGANDYTNVINKSIQEMDNEV